MASARCSLGFTLALLALAGTAHAKGWDWDEETRFRIWGNNSQYTDWNLEWAQDIHPQHPSFTWLMDNVPPPPREMWCTEPDSGPTPQDCAIHHDLLEDWAEDFLGEYHPWYELYYDEECPASCY